MSKGFIGPQDNLDKLPKNIVNPTLIEILYTANIYIFFTLERQWNVAKSTFINCKFSNIFEFFFTLDKCLNYNISMYFKNTMKKT